MSRNNYIIKFEDQTYLTKHDAIQISNANERWSQFDKVAAVRFQSKLTASLVCKLVGGKQVDTLETTERYEAGKIYLTLSGNHFYVSECKDNRKGYETVKGNLRKPCGKLVKEGGHRYNRSTGGWCNGRTTGSNWTEDCLRYPPEEV